MLISTILRQYFMSLKVLGKWKRWGPSMDRAFSSIQTSIERTHAVYPASPTTKSPTSPKFPRHPHIVRLRKQDTESPATSDSEADPDTDEEDHYDDSRPIRFSERELDVLRRVMRKWWRLAGLKGSPRCCDELEEGEFSVDWTKAIAPRVEGRIEEIRRT